jgi:hypothetical protein
MAEIGIKVTGLSEITAKLKEAPETMRATFSAAGNEVAREVLDVEGVRRYPPAPRAYAPPYPYYVRGVGTQYSPAANSMSSEKFGTQFYTESQPFKVVIGNRASYAKWIVGEAQANRMAGIGWRRLVDVAQEKIGPITKIFQGWIDRALKM